MEAHSSRISLKKNGWVVIRSVPFKIREVNSSSGMTRSVQIDLHPNEVAELVAQYEAAHLKATPEAEAFFSQDLDAILLSEDS